MNIEKFLLGPTLRSYIICYFTVCPISVCDLLAIMKTKRSKYVLVSFESNVPDQQIKSLRSTLYRTIATIIWIPLQTYIIFIYLCLHHTTRRIV